MDQGLPPRLQSFSRWGGEDDHEHQDPSMIPATSTKDLWQTHQTEEAALSCVYPGHQYDVNLVQPMASPSRPPKTIRLGFLQTDAGRRGIRLHHELQGRLRRAPPSVWTGR